LQGRKSKGGKTKKSKNDEEDDEDLTADMVSVEKIYSLTKEVYAGVRETTFPLKVKRIFPY
jgi:hypothetical protein